MAKTLPEEPDRGSQICGEQVAYGMPWDRYCGERKAPGLFHCQEHHQAVMDEYGYVRMAPGNAPGLPPVRKRDVPHFSGEAAIYSPEFLRRREGNDLGTEPYVWRVFV